MRRLLVLQLCRFGDILQTTPMLRGIRTDQPDTHVTLVLHDMFRHVPIPASLYDELVIFPYTEVASALSEDASRWSHQVHRLQEFVDALGPEPFDLTLNLTHSDLSSLLVAAIPSRDVRGGLVAPDRTRVVRGEVMTYFWASQFSRAQGCFNLVDLYNWAAGVPCRRAGLEVEIPDDARRRMQGWLATRGLVGRPLICVQLGASDERKRWPPEQFAEAINLLDAGLGEIVLVGTEAEQPLCERALARITRPVHDSFGQTSIVELAALLESADVLLTNDTGAMHVATAVGTRVVDLSTGPVFAHETGPYGDGHLVIEPHMACFPCVAGSECHHLSCRESFTPRDIAALVLHALGRGPLPRPSTSRILQARFREHGGLEYRPVWSPAAEPQDLIRPLSADIWEPTLVPRQTKHLDGLSSSSGRTLPAHTSYPDLFSDAMTETCAAFHRVAARADRAAQLTAGLAAASPGLRVSRMAEVGRELDALRLEGELDAACLSIVAYLRVRLDSTTETDVERLARTYACECELSAYRARQLADRIAMAVAAPECRTAV